MTDLFDKEQPDVGTTPTSTQKLADLVGPDKKFKTVEDLANGKLESDRFINTLKEEAAGMRSQLEQLQKQADTAATLQAMLDKIAASKDTGTDNTLPTPGASEDISKLVREQLSEIDQERSRKANRDKANAALLAKFGNAEAAKAHLQAEATKIGMTVKQLGDMSETSPAAFAKLVGLEGRTDPGKGLPMTTRMDQSMSQNLNGERNASYYRELRKQLGSKFYSVDVQQQRMKDAMRLGDAYHN